MAAQQTARGVGRPNLLYTKDYADGTTKFTVHMDVPLDEDEASKLSDALKKSVGTKDLSEVKAILKRNLTDAAAIRLIDAL